MTFTNQDSETLFNELAAFSDIEFVNELKLTAELERHTIVRTCHFINELERRRCFDLIGAPNAFYYLTKIEGFSEGSANRRIQSARLLRALPDTAEKLASGELSMDVVATVQRTIKASEKQTGHKVSDQARTELLEKVENKSKREAEKVMALEFPQVSAKNDVIEYKNGDEVRAHLTLSQATLEKYERIADLLSHQIARSNGGSNCGANYGSNLGTVLDLAADKLLSLIDPLKKEVKARKKKNQNSISPADRNFVMKRDNSECQMILSNGEKCLSTYQVQVDHIIPEAKGGSSLPENLRCLCRQHNFQAAEKEFGKEHMAQFLS